MTDHVTSDLDRLTTQKGYNGNDKIQVANGTGLSISHIGDSQLSGSTHSFTLKNILHVPSIICSPLIYSQLTSSPLICSSSRD